jgi:hypothetical protein
MVDDGRHRSRDKAHVWRPVIAQRSRDADQNSVDGADFSEIIGRVEALRLSPLDLFRLDAVDIRLTRVQPVDLRLIDIESGYPEAFLAEEKN